MEFPKLTANQIYTLSNGKKHWTEKKGHLIKVAKSYGKVIH